VTQESDQARQEQIAGTAAPLLSDAALAFFALYLVVIGFDIFPPRPLDPLWLLTTAASLCNSMTIPFAGLTLLHISAALAPMNNRVQQRREFYSRVAAWVALGFLLLLPLIGYANWRGIRNVNTNNVQAVSTVKRNASRLISQINAARTPQELQQKLRRYQGPVLPNSELNQPLPQLKKQALTLVNQILNRYLESVPKPSSEAYGEIYRQSVRTALMALLGCLASASLAWDTRGSKSILRELFSTDSDFAREWLGRPAQKLGNMFKDLKAWQAHTTGRQALRRQSDELLKQRKQSQQEVQRKIKQSQIEQRKLRNRMGKK
jgi:hypothetical protein